MDWGDVGRKLAEIGLPLLGAALPVPGGLALGKMLGAALGAKSPEEALLKVLKTDEGRQKAEEFQALHQERILSLLIEAEKAERAADNADMTTVNQTMIEELRNSQNETWYQKGWRPANGFCVALGSFVSVVAMCWLMYEAIIGKDITALNAIPALATSIGLILAVPGAAVGITSWHRGMQQRKRSEIAGRLTGKET